MYRTYLYLLYTAKDLAKKNESDHGGAARRASSGMAFVIETKSLRWVDRGPCRRIINNSLNLLRKKLITTLIYFNLSFRLLPTQSPQN